MQDELLTERDLCSFLRVSRSTIVKLRAEDNLPFFRVGDSIRYVKKDVEDWLVKQQAQTKEGDVQDEE